MASSPSPPIHTPPQGPPKVKMTLKQFLLSRSLDLVLIGAAALCFEGFAQRSVAWKHLSGIGDSIAFLTSGDALRKPSGVDAYSDIGVGTELKSLDAVWVPSGKRAVIHFADDGSRVELEERTLIILKEPLKRRYDRSHASSAVEKVTGKASAVDADGKRTELGVPPPPAKLADLPEAEPSAASPPDPTPSRSPEAKPSLAPLDPPPKLSEVPAEFGRKVYPRDKMSIYILNKKPTFLVHFTWPEKITGKLIVENSTGANVTTLTLLDARDGKAELDPVHLYRWKLILDSGKTLGPYQFVLKRIDKSEVKSVMRMGSDSVEIAW